MDNLEYIFWPTQRPHHFVSFHHLWSVLRKLWFRNVSNLYPLNTRRIQIYKLFKLEPRIGIMIIMISCKQFVKYTHAKWQPVQKIIHLTRNNLSVSPENMDAIYLFQLRKLCFFHHVIADILLKVALNTKNQSINHPNICILTKYKLKSS